MVGVVVDVVVGVVVDVEDVVLVVVGVAKIILLLWIHHQRSYQSLRISMPLTDDFN